VLINENGEPWICDFGILKIINSPGFTTEFVGTPFMAPELFSNNNEEDTGSDVETPPKITKETDIYAYGIVALQVSFEPFGTFLGHIYFLVLLCI
jgi:serine/threonine protein kinase